MGISLSTATPRSERATSISDSTCETSGAERDLLAEERHLARLQPGEVEQLLDQPAEPLGLRQHHLQRLGVRLLDAVEEVLEVRADRGDRRLQLVGDVRDQVAAGLAPGSRARRSSG